MSKNSRILQNFYKIKRKKEKKKKSEKESKEINNDNINDKFLKHKFLPSFCLIPYFFSTPVTIEKE